MPLASAARTHVATCSRSVTKLRPRLPLRPVLIRNYTQAARQNSNASSQSGLTCAAATRLHPSSFTLSARAAVFLPVSRRAFASSPGRTPQGDEIVTRLEDMYGTARDEFEIAAEETSGNTVYAAEDRKAAREAFDALRAAYDAVINPENPAPELATASSGSSPASLDFRRSVADEVQTRIGHRIRELENAVENLETLATEMD